MTLARLVLAIRLKSINFGNQEIEILIVTVPVFWQAKLWTGIIVLEIGSGWELSIQYFQYSTIPIELQLRVLHII